jgi:Flp pilus assembly protein TadG
MNSRRTLRRPFDSDRGAAAVEFAIVVVLLLVIIMAIIDFGRLLFVQQSIKAATREGARVAAVGANWGPAGTSGTVQKTVVDAAAAAVALAAGSSGLVITPTPAAAGNAPLCSAAGSSVKIDARVTFKWLTPIGALLRVIPGNSGGGNALESPERTVSAATTMRCE